MSKKGIETLVGLFYRRSDDLAQFEEVGSRELARDYRMLLAHDSHMTVTVERFHNGPVNVQVLESRLDGAHYARKILLVRASDGVVVQFGIMRLDFSAVSPEIRHAVEARRTPLGRILIEHNVLREIVPMAFLRVMPGPAIAEWFGPKLGLVVTYGRLGAIHFDEKPAIEVLEIVAPVPPGAIP